MKVVRKLAGVLVVLLVTVSGQQVVLARGSQYITIDDPYAVCAGPGTGTAIYGINPEGDVVGFYTDASQVVHDFVRRGNTFTTFAPPGSQFPLATGIAPSGKIVGAYFDSSFVPHGYLFYRGTYTTFDVPGSQGTVPFGIDPQGDAAGYYIDSIGSGVHGFVRKADGSFTIFDVRAGVQGTIASGIDARGDVSGFYFDSNGISHGFLRARSGNITSFDAPNAAGGTYANAINARGDITGGWIESPSPFVVHGFLRAADGTITTFDDPSYQFDPNPDATGLDQGTSPHGITPQGIIAGKYTDANGCYHGFVRLPG